MRREHSVIACCHVLEFVVITGPGGQIQGLMKAMLTMHHGATLPAPEAFLMIYPSPDVIRSTAIPRDGIKTEEASFAAHSWALHGLGPNTEIAAL